MRVVIDTNVFVSGVFWSGSPAAVLDAWRDGRIRVVLSPGILAEYERVGSELGREHLNIQLNGIIQLLAMNSQVVNDTVLPGNMCSDPDDDKFLAAAVAGRASFVVTGDKALLKVGEYRGVRTISPSAFVKKCLTERG